MSHVYAFTYEDMEPTERGFSEIPYAKEPCTDCADIREVLKPFQGQMEGS